MRKARENNAGWRIDYFIVSKDIEANIKEAGIHNEFLVVTIVQLVWN